MMNKTVLDHQRCWALVDLDIMEENLRRLKERIPDGCAFMAVVKANGYGHGMVPMAKLCAENGADWLGVATADEAIELREQGLTPPILVLGVTDPERACQLRELRLTQIVPSLAYARELSRRLPRASNPLCIHFCVDTGMGRLGHFLQKESLPGVCREIREASTLPGLRLEGLMTQLSSARGAAPEAAEYSRRQFALFAALRGRLREEGLAVRWCHALNSGGIIRYPEEALDMVRIGHLLTEPVENDCGVCSRPALQFETTIADIKDLPAGACIGYGRSFRLPAPAKIAVLNMGYCDGYGFALSKRGRLLLRGKKISVVGNICMDQTMADVSDIPDARPGDVVTVVGENGGLTQSAEEVDQQADGLFDGAFACRLTARVPRYYLRAGRLLRYDSQTREFCAVNSAESRENAD